MDCIIKKNLLVIMPALRGFKVYHILKFFASASIYMYQSEILIMFSKLRRKNKTVIKKGVFGSKR